MKAVYGNPLQLGVTKVKDGYNFAVRSFADELTLEIYPVTASGDKKDSPVFTVDMDETYKFGDVFAAMVTGGDIEGCGYRYTHDGRMVADDYAANLSGCSVFGHTIPDAKYITRIRNNEYDWGNDRFPRIPYDECIFYKLHVRGFTKSRTSGVETSRRGTFAGITDKIPYMKKLGITTVELMPAYEFDEAGRFASDKEKRYAAGAERGGCINYWGYLGGFHFAPKAAYCSVSDKSADYTDEFRDMVKALHAEGIEVVMEMYFKHDESYMIEDCLRYWVMNYHVDGFHIYCDECRLSEVADDPVLGSTKIITVYWNGASGNAAADSSGNMPKLPKKSKHMASYNTGFDEVSKRLLKGDENQLQAFARLLRANPKAAANINYVTNHNGFTMMDLVSYDRKHNEANGEGNRDGESFNHSWNCGVEGPSRKKKINDLRTRQIKNAFAMLFCAQGTPLILAGDEFGNSQSGNNNPYCIDNETTWLEWKDTMQAHAITDFLESLIAFRKKHKIIHMASELTAADALSCGYPDISYHGDNAWYSRMESYDRHIGVMYCSKYVKDAPADEVIYVAYNLHWEPHHLALPDLPENNGWKIALTTGAFSTGTADEPKIDNRQIIAPPRSVTILTGSLAKTATAKRRRRRS